MSALAVRRDCNGPWASRCAMSRTAVRAASAGAIVGALFVPEVTASTERFASARTATSAYRW